MPKRVFQDPEILAYVKKQRMQLTLTKFDETTLEENKAYRQEHKLECLYQVPFPLAQTIPHKQPVLVLEMNNKLNRIEGIGYIRNVPKPGYCHPIHGKFFDANPNHTHLQYSKSKDVDVDVDTEPVQDKDKDDDPSSLPNPNPNPNPNPKVKLPGSETFVYEGLFRLDREDLMSPEANPVTRELVLALDHICFKGTRHLKRPLGIVRFPMDMQYYIHQDAGVDIVQVFQDEFRKLFSRQKKMKQDQAAAAVIAAATTTEAGTAEASPLETAETSDPTPTQTPTQGLDE